MFKAEYVKGLIRIRRTALWPIIIKVACNSLYSD